MSFWKTIKDLIFGAPLKDQFEKMIEEAKPVVVHETIDTAKVVQVEEPAAVAQVTDQITDAVTAEAPKPVEAEPSEPVAPKPKRARTAKGKLAKDDPATPDVNEAWEGGKAPVKKAKKAPSKKKKK